MKITKIDLHIKIDDFSRLDQLRESVISVKKPSWYTESYDHCIVMAGYLVVDADLYDFIDKMIIKDFVEDIKFLIFTENRYSFDLSKDVYKKYTISCFSMNDKYKVWRIWKEFHDIEATDCAKVIIDGFTIMEKEFVLNSFITPLGADNED